MKNIILLILFCLISFKNYASFIASNRDDINPNLDTHLLIAGAPDNLGELFIYSLLTKSKIYQEKSNNEQIIIVGRNEDQSLIKNAGFKIINSKIGMLKPDAIKSAIQKVKHLKSIDIFAHSNALAGISLDTNTWIYELLNEKDDLWDTVANKIDPTSFIFIYGCNAGIKLAPLLADKLKIAVWAALTSTDFQHIYQDNIWSFDYNVKSSAKNENNTLNYIEPMACNQYCTRMKPDNSSYKGHWGNWSAGGYPTYKLFCGQNDNKNCGPGALEAIYTFPSSHKYKSIKNNLSNFKNQLIEFMCPFSYNDDKQKVCQLELENSLLSNIPSSYSPFKGKTLVCDRVKCKAHFKCSSYNAAFDPSSCTLENDSNEISTAFTDEYKFLVETFTNNNLTIDQSSL